MRPTAIWMGVISLGLLLSTATAADTPPQRYVNLEKGDDGERSTLPVWKSYDVMMQCMQKSLRGLMNHEKNKAFEGGPCTEGRVANLTHGTVVEPIEPSAECGTLIKARIQSGDAAGKVACIPGEELSSTLLP
jgi:hypothetical protein